MPMGKEIAVQSGHDGVDSKWGGQVLRSLLTRASRRSSLTKAPTSLMPCLRPEKMRVVFVGSRSPASTMNLRSKMTPMAAISMDFRS